MSGRCALGTLAALLNPRRAEVQVGDDEQSARVARLLSHARPEYRQICKGILLGSSSSFAQGWQDWYIYHNYFRDREWGEGTFIDIGTSDPLVISNTLFFEQCLGWSGVCVEMNPIYHRSIRKRRNCSLVPRCMRGTAGPVAVRWDGMQTQAVAAGTSAPPAPHPARAMQTCVTFDAVWASHALEEVDLVSMDIEGSEASVARCLDLRRYNVHLWLVETHHYHQPAVNMLFQRFGYASVATFLNAAAADPAKNYFIDTLYERLQRGPPLVPRQAACDDLSMPYRGMWCTAWQREYREHGDDAWSCQPGSEG